jgi:hypothetical protein
LGVLDRRDDQVGLETVDAHSAGRADQQLSPLEAQDLPFEVVPDHPREPPGRLRGHFEHGRQRGRNEPRVAARRRTIVGVSDAPGRVAIARQVTQGLLEQGGLRPKSGPQAPRPKAVLFPGGVLTRLRRRVVPSACS